MRTLATHAGPFVERPYYSLSELESICSQELAAVELMPSTPEPIRIERFVEKRFKVTPRYDELPDGVMGFTVFGPDGVREIVVARSLDESTEVYAEGQVRSTIAHEAGHGLLHAHLFALSTPEKSLFGDYSDPEKPKVLCRDVLEDRPSGRSYDGRWWEFQANKAIGGLLMPKKLVHEAVRPYLSERGSLGSLTLAAKNREDAGRGLAKIFEVNPIVARIRLSDLFPAEEEGQLSL